MTQTLPPPAPDARPIAGLPPTPYPHRRSGVSWVGRALRALLASAGVAASFALDGGIFAAVVVLFALIVPFEKLYPRRRGQRIRRPMLLTDLTFALTGPVLNVVGIAAGVVIGVASLAWLPALALRPLVTDLSPAVAGALAFVLFDFLGYWAHRWAHEVPALWRFHAVHHSPEHMDWISGFRVHPFDGVLIAPGVVFLLAAGFDAEVTGVLAVLQIVLGIFFHANVRVRWRWLDKLVANPEFHHWHHANESDAIGHNYAPALPQWDLLFGTYFMPDRSTGRRPRHYGVDGFAPRHYVDLLTHPLRGVRGHGRLILHPVRAVRALVAGGRSVAGDVRRSTFRPTRSVRVHTAPGCRSTNASLFDGGPVPGVAPERPVGASIPGDGSGTERAGI